MINWFTFLYKKEKYFLIEKKKNLNNFEQIDLKYTIENLF